MIFDSIFASSVKESRRATGPAPSAFSMPMLRPISPQVPRVGVACPASRHGGAARRRAARAS
eukprot:786469-Pleurochrysis_carterae.AAC.1